MDAEPTIDRPLGSGRCRTAVERQPLSSPRFPSVCGSVSGGLPWRSTAGVHPLGWDVQNTVFAEDHDGLRTERGIRQRDTSAP